MRKKVGVFFIVVIVAAFFLSSKNFPVEVWNNLFLIGLVLFMCGGGLLVLSKGIFNRFTHGFKLLLKNTSKLEEYVSEVDERTANKSNKINATPVILFLLLSGGLLLTISTFYSYYLF